MATRAVLTLVGTPETAAPRMRDYQAAGVETFILSRPPHLEEAYRLVELVVPHLQMAHPAGCQADAGNIGPLGEIIANQHAPEQRRAAAE